MARKRRRINGFKLLLLFIAVCFLLALAHKEYNIYQVNKELEKTQNRIESLKEEQETLETERQRLDDLKYIEKLAREEHNMVGKDEVPLFIIEETGAQPGTGKQYIVFPVDTNLLRRL